MVDYMELQHFLKKKYIISYEDSKKKLINSSILKKRRCTGLTIKGFQCSRLVSVTNKYCFQHKSINLINDSKVSLKTIKLVTKKKLTNSFSMLSLSLNDQLNKNLKKDYGIFFTSQILINIILNRLKIILSKINIRISKILEPSCGSGEFLFSLNKYFCKTKILGIEHNESIYNKIKNFSLTNNILVIKKKNFLKFYNKKGFDLIIGNPPYKGIKKALVSDYRSFFSNKVNLYCLFILHSLKHLTPGGILVFVLPKSFLNSMSYNNIRIYIKNNCKILFIIDNLVEKYFLGTNVETCVLFLQKKKSLSKKYYVFFGNYLSFNNQYKYLNKLLIEGKPLKNFGFNITVGNVLKSNKNKFSGARGYLICSNNISNNILVLNSTSIIFSDNLQYGSCIVVSRGFGNTKFIFKYALVNIKEGFLIENHLLVIKQTENSISLSELTEKFKNENFLNFISLYFSYQSLNIKELELLPIF